MASEVASVTGGGGFIPGPVPRALVDADHAGHDARGDLGRQPDRPPLVVHLDRVAIRDVARGRRREDPIRVHDVSDHEIDDRLQRHGLAEAKFRIESIKARKATADASARSALGECLVATVLWQAGFENLLVLFEHPARFDRVGVQIAAGACASVKRMPSAASRSMYGVGTRLSGL